MTLMILIVTRQNLVLKAREYGADAVTLEHLSGSGVNVYELARKADVVVFVDTVRYKVLKDRYGPDFNACGYVTSGGETGLAPMMQKWAERYKA